MRVIQQIRLTTAALPAALLLLHFFPTSPLYPTCSFHQYTGLLCPGCGATRALAALTHAQFTEAMHLNPLLIAAVIPAALVYLTLAHYRRTWPRIPIPCTYAALATTTLFTLTRNLI